jgi:choline dehydrogenase-like flavoprotein
MTANHYDVIIIGTDAGGGILAYHLAPSGKRLGVALRKHGVWPKFYGLTSKTCMDYAPYPRPLS